MKIINESAQSSLKEWMDRSPSSQWLSASPSFTGKEHTDPFSLPKRSGIYIQLLDDTYSPGMLMQEVWRKIVIPYKEQAIDHLQHNILEQAMLDNRECWLTPLPAHPKDRQFSTNMEKILRISNDMVTYLLELRQSNEMLDVPWIFKVNISLLDKVSTIFLQRLILRSKEMPIAFDTYYFWKNQQKEMPGDVNQLIYRRVKDFYNSIGTFRLEPTHLRQPIDINRSSLPLERALIWCEGYAALSHGSDLKFNANNDDEEAEALMIMMRAYLFERQLSSAARILQKIVQQSKCSKVIRARACIFYALLLANHIKQPEAALPIVTQGKALLKNETGEAANREMGWLNNVEALIFYRLKRLSAAAKALQQVKTYITLVEEEDAALLSAAFTQNSSYLYEAIGKIEKAIQTQQIFLKRGDNLNDELLMSHWFRIGFLKGEIGEYEEAVNWLLKAYQTCSDMGDWYMQEWIARSAAYIWLKANQPNQAVKWLERSAEGCKKVHMITEWVDVTVTRIAVCQLIGVQKQPFIRQLNRLKNSHQTEVEDGLKRLERFKREEIQLHHLLPKPNSRFYYPFHKLWF
ncbi:hypothetical protein P4637_14775 [Halalkalibacterium halodurans]|uniref:BH2038 protein n=2 Tax=Halalkalibacterium halodurans TaxID=86665 RepID=Q9KB90_HALH5|nr:hypothetical protein [Halalkalibacterium halodurans]MED4080826.1 hypothetical protein [Halalkalibacterium halodurans]MED4086070.1 hypothetical protein [Halalkalibacterium halodurans]MED4106773.1 hypothetical protein [Halalkalibacterium halodurans]MED4109530.1 hypothetical protein [Halalkalibacterium halodurans]MED4149835.1 hypothetical protein [Halalkalibacterium halodurans]